MDGKNITDFIDPDILEKRDSPGMTPWSPSRSERACLNVPLTMTHASLHCYGPQLLEVMSIARSTEVNVISSSTTTRRAPDSPSILSSRGGRCRTTPVSIWTCSLRAQADEVAEYLGVRDADVHVRTGVRIPADSIAGQTRGPAAEGFCTLGCSTASDIVVNLFPHKYGRRYHLMRAPSLAILVWDLLLS